MRELIIGKNDGGQRLDKFLSKKFKTLPKSLMYKYIRKKCVKLNGSKCSPDDVISEGDVLTFYIKDEFFEASVQKSYEFMKAPKKLNIIYEDENILLADKQPGLIAHPDKNYHFDSLVSRIQHYLYSRGEYDPENEQSFSPALVNRIDRNTGGIVIAAKNAEALRILNRKMKSRELEKHYLCLVHGTPQKDEAVLTAYTTKNEVQNKVAVFDSPRPGSKEITTKYKVLKSGSLSLLDVELLTGRTHQIRAHMTHIGCPLAGDTKYGKNKKAPDGFKYQALYSYKLKFDFKTDAGILNYLNGKEFEIPAEKIWFINPQKVSR